jgi:acyl-CoA dehydrogenase
MEVDAPTTSGALRLLLGDRHADWRDKCHGFAREVMRPAAAELDATGSFPFEVIREARRRGLHDFETTMRAAADPHGLMLPIFSEELHWGCPATALAMGAASGVATMIAAEGTPEQVGRFGPACFGDDDDVGVAAFAQTEPGAGSDVRTLATRARFERGEWVLDGTKTLIGNAGLAAVTLVAATVDPELGRRGQARFVVPRGTAGVEAGAAADTMGLRATHVGTIVLTDCRLSPDLLLGGADRLERRLARARQGGARRQPGEAEHSRPVFAAGAVGIARAALEWTVEHLADRNGGADEGVQTVIGEVATEIDGARLLTWRAAWMARQGLPFEGGEAFMAKLKAADVAVSATSRLMDVVGRQAASADCPLERWLRDAKAFQIFEGTAELERVRVAERQRALVGRPERTTRAEEVPDVSHVR